MSIEQKQTHRCGEHTSGYLQGEGREGAEKGKGLRGTNYYV